jgi:hypothetical protein
MISAWAPVKEPGSRAKAGAEMKHRIEAARKIVIFFILPIYLHASKHQNV